MTDATFARLRGMLRAATRRAAPAGVLVAGLARIGPDGAEDAWIQGRDGPGGPAVRDPARRIRVASVTKMAVARAAATLDPDAAVSAWLDWPAGIAVPRLRHLMSHTSGVTDAAGYVVEPPDTPEAHLGRHPEATSGHAPGTFFRYANLNYVLLGAVLERETHRPLGAVVRDAVLAPAGVAGGLNWFGVADRADRLAAWRWVGARHDRQVDGVAGDWAADVIWRDGAGIASDGWRPGHAAWFSPQGGLRANVLELARLARFCCADGAAPEWTFDGGNGRDGGGLFRAYGRGVTIYDGHPAIPGRLWGHAGHALGVSAGAWWNPDARTAWGYVLNGRPDLSEGHDDEAFFDALELPLIRAFAAP